LKVHKKFKWPVERRHLPSVLDFGVSHSDAEIMAEMEMREKEVKSFGLNDLLVRVTNLCWEFFLH
jgi:hypothetical protein